MAKKQKLQAPDGWELVEKPGQPKRLLTKADYGSGIGILFNRKTQSLDIYGWYDSMVGIQGGQIALRDILVMLGQEVPRG